MDKKENRHKIISEVIEDIDSYLSEDIEKLIENKSIKVPDDVDKDFNKYEMFQKISVGTDKIDRYKRKNKIARVFNWACASIVVMLLFNLCFSFIRDSFWSGTSNQHEVVYVEKGDKLLVILTDGSRVWLNSDSKLSYPKTFDRDVREVILEGEAYFEVAKNEKQPFKVYADQMAIKVLGTSFNVRAYPTDDFVKTTLDSGKIKIEGMKDNPMSYLIDPGQTAIYKKGDTKCSVQQDQYSCEASLWKSNQLIFRNESLEYVLNTLVRKFGIDYKIEDESVELFTYTFTTKSNSLEEIIDIMRSITPIHIFNENNVLHVKHK